MDQNIFLILDMLLLICNEMKEVPAQSTISRSSTLGGHLDKTKLNEFLINDIMHVHS